MQEAAAICLFNLFMKKIASAAHNEKLTSKHETQTWIPTLRKTTTKTIYLQLVNYLLRIYGTEENIADTEDATTMFAQPSFKAPLQKP